MAQKLLAGNETVLILPAIELNGEPQIIGDALVPLSAPTSAVLNKWLSVTNTASLSAGGNVSCALRDDLKLDEAASDTSKARTICSTGKKETPTFYNFDAQMNGFADEDPDAQGVFNLFRDLTFAADVPYILAKRIGYRPTVAAAAGQIWNFFYSWTDWPVWSFPDGDYITIGETFISKNLIHVRAVLAS